MWTLLVVILPPAFDLSSWIAQADEPVGVQEFIPQPAVEAFYVGVLDGLTGLNELQLHTTFCAPGRQGSTAKPRPVIPNGRLRQSSLARRGRSVYGKTNGLQG
jgi:hypothetical protein